MRGLRWYLNVGPAAIFGEVIMTLSQKPNTDLLFIDMISEVTG